MSPSGTNKPAKYHVLVDENKFPADMIYKLTYHLCHVYARCTRYDTKWGGVYTS